jgi:TatD DNase family protein
MYIDSHAHLFYEDFKNDIDDVVRRAQDAGVEACIVPGTTLETSRESIELAQKYSFVYACVGFHPHESSTATDSDLSEIEALSVEKKVVGIGEIGLDFHYDFSPRETQERVFNDQIGIAARRNLPIVVHTRESMDRTLQIVTGSVAQHSGWEGKPGAEGNGSLAGRGVFHCFTGTSDDAEKLFRLGFYVSYPGIVTFKNSPVLTTLKTIGAKNIMLETDSPYLAPVPFRGKRNEPAHVVHVANKIAELLNTEPSQVGAVTSKNARSLFSI